jgi:hypothetical protein
MSGSGLSLPPWREHTVCAVCPSLLLRLGEFDVAPKPSRDSQYDPAVDYRVTPAGVGVCVHPDKLGVPPGLYASGADPVPEPPWTAEQDPDPEPADPQSAPWPVSPPGPVADAPSPDPPEDGTGDEWLLAQPAPEVPQELLVWLREQVAEAMSGDFGAALDRVETSARQTWPAEVVVEALRRVLSGG